MATFYRLLCNMTVQKKLFSGFGLVLAILLGISWLSMQALSSLSERFALLNQVKTISILVGEARQQEKNFMLRLDEQYLTEANALIAQSIELADSASAAFTTSDSIAQMQQMQQEASRYQQELATYLELERTSQLRQQQMEENARYALNVFNQLELQLREQTIGLIQAQGDQASIQSLQQSQLASDAARALLEARRLERTFVMSESLDDYNALQQQLGLVEQYSQQLRQSGLHRSLLTELDYSLEQLQQYQQYFTEFRRLVEAANTSEQQLNTQARLVVDSAEQSLERQLGQMQRQEQQLRWVLLIASSMALLLGIAAALLITRLIVLPLQQVVAVANKIADGDLTEDLHSDRKDELGQLTQAMQRMTVSLRQLILRLSSGITQLASSTEEMAVISQQTSAGVSQQKVETEQVAAAMNEMTATVQEVARSAEEASNAATQSAEQAELSNQILDKTMSGIKQLAKDVNQSASSIAELQEEANSIGSILDVISSITEQTNLLALNAAIEAARAGEAGRGFSVVADEVRQLATRAQASTAQIDDVIKRLQRKTELAVAAMQANTELANNVFESTDDASDAIESILQNIQNIQQMNQQIAAAALQQSTVAEEINRSLTNIQVATEQSSVAIEETAKTSSTLSQLGLEQQELAHQFRLSAA
ncbi:methyl-accepting chemotaxis protein [Alkalimonas delamerensis]|uniref:Methyl-accepting chemotaxis protein n=1 Tax=Alkalimonas delamerensis TaxID=265981 RepID=A0ABT9GLX7_9GAMM|nr:methyl-accepting chemotaxis protein [Alkalimonas delamerensis]MDP4527970.1 methyl-accepting chemotaxis protein [Alkalimonas delamerensis]